MRNTAIIILITLIIGISTLSYFDGSSTCYERCINIKHKIAIKRLLSRDELEVLEETGSSREEIIEVARIIKENNQKEFCQHLKSIK